MISIKSNWKYLLYCICYSIFGDAGTSLIPIICLLILFVLIIIKVRLSCNKYIEILDKMGVYLIIISLIFIIIWGFCNGELTLYGEFLPIKIIKILLQYFSYVSYIVCVITLSKNLSLKQLFLSIVITCFILAFICLIEIT